MSSQIQQPSNDIDRLPTGAVRQASSSEQSIGEGRNTVTRRIIGALEKTGEPIRSVFPAFRLPNASEIPDKARRIAKRQQILLDLMEPPLPPAAQESILVRRCLQRICTPLGIDSRLFTVTVSTSETPNAYVNIPERRVVCTTSLLRVLGGDEKKITSVLGHEMGHVTLVHYDMSEPLIQIDDKESGFDLSVILANQARSYDQEYQADRLSCLALVFAGIPPEVMSHALKDVDAWTNQFLEKQAERADDFAQDPRQRDKERTIIPWAVQSHPLTKRRIRALDRLIRQLPRVSPEAPPFPDEEPIVAGKESHAEPFRSFVRDWPVDISSVRLI